MPDADALKRKRSRLGESNASHLVAYIQSNAFENLNRRPPVSVGVDQADAGGAATSRVVRQINRTKIKKEPVDIVVSDENGKLNSPAGYPFDAFASPNVAAFMPRYPLNPSMPFTANIRPFPESVSPNPPFQQYGQPFPLSPSMGYNIPAHSPVPGTSEPPKAKPDARLVSGNSYMDLDTSNIHQAQRLPDGGDLNDCLPSMCLPITDSNEILIQEHLLENLSISLSNLDVGNDVGDRVVNDATNNLQAEGKPSSLEESKVMATRSKAAPPQVQSTNVPSASSAMNLSISDFPELPQFCSTDLEGADGFASIASSSSLIKEIEDLNTLSKPSNQL